MNYRKILPVFSYVFHPLFITLYGTFFYFYSNNSNHSSSEITNAFISISIITIVVPILVFFILRATGQLTSMMVAGLSERKIPLVIQCFLTILLIRKSIPLEQFPALHFYILGGLISTILALVFLFFKTKVSLHMIATSALGLFILELCIFNQNNYVASMLFMVVSNVLVGASRVEMKAHTPKELAIGFMIGLVPQLLLLFLWL